MVKDQPKKEVFYIKLPNSDGVRKLINCRYPKMLLLSKAYGDLHFKLICITCIQEVQQISSLLWLNWNIKKNGGLEKTWVFLHIMYQVPLKWIPVYQTVSHNVSPDCNAIQYTVVIVLQWPKYFMWFLWFHVYFENIWKVDSTFIVQKRFLIQVGIESTNIIYTF